MDEFKHYPGSKNSNGTWQRIINLIPPHSEYRELFLGGGAILRNKKEAETTVANEYDPLIYSKWQDFKMKGLYLYNRDALQLIPHLMTKDKLRDKDKNVFMYLDPPYPLGSRRSQRKLYDCELTDNQHIDLLQMVLTVENDCMISTYPNKIYSEMLKDWYKVEFKNATRGYTATEVLYMNYPLPEKLHDYRYLGTDCWDRQRIKRKIDRRVHTLSKLPILEQRAIINQLNERLSNR